VGEVVAGIEAAAAGESLLSPRIATMLLRKVRDRGTPKPGAGRRPVAMDCRRAGGVPPLRRREVILPRNVVRELCKCFDWVRVDGERVAASVLLDYREVLENTEEALVDIFREHGPALDRPTAIDLGQQYGLESTTTALYLGWPPVIDRIATNRYALRGADVPTGTLEAMRGPSSRPRAARLRLDYQRRLWIGYTLSQAVIDSHVVAVPGALKNELRGGDEVARYDFAVPNDDIGDLATDGHNVWGLRRLLKRYAAEAGDAASWPISLGCAHRTTSSSSST
jgi:hypothetical protein